MITLFRTILFSMLLFLSSANCFAFPDNNTEHQRIPFNQEINDEQAKNAESAIGSAIRASTFGPKTVTILEQGKLDIPDGYLYVPQKEAAELMHAIGNRTNNNFVGIILSKEDQLRWFIMINFIKSGYVRDNEAKSWDVEELLQSLKKGTEEDNQVRLKNGFPQLSIEGWIEQPTYNSTAHQLVWSMLVNDNSSSEPTVNFNTYALGREGYLTFNMVTSKFDISQNKIHVKNILSSFHYNEGKRYEDFIKSTDRVATYGLAALITGVVAKKLGLLALAGVFFIKLSKLLFVVPVIIVSRLKKLFRKKQAKSV